MLERQLALEREMVDAGIERYQRVCKTAEESGRGSDTTYAKRLLPELCRDLADSIETAKLVKKAGVQAVYLGLLRGIDSNQAAFITLKVIFDSMMKADALTSIAISVGQRIEDQIRFHRFEEENTAYYTAVIEDFRRKGTASYRHMHRVLTKKANERADRWVEWTPRERLLLGVKLIELCILSTGLIKKVVVRSGRGPQVVARLEATEDTMQWIDEHMHEAELLHPITAPCLIPPNDWVGVKDGGYYTPDIRRRVQFIKTKSKAHRTALEGADFSKPMAAVNAIQKTPWRVNKAVHDVIKEVWRRNLRIGMPASHPFEVPACPVPRDLPKERMTEDQQIDFTRWKREAALCYTSERDRISKCLQLSRVLSMSQKYRDEKEFYYVYTCDFRGRIYAASPGLSPQGADFSKGLIEFANGKPLGERGAFWLSVHGANTYGYDKDTYAGRAAWVEEHSDIICRTATDPFGSTERSFWSDADKPYQFLAFCFEYAAFRSTGPTYVSRLPIALDGSCNGLQNFSAMLRDAIGGSATNLCRVDKPADIYQTVANRTAENVGAVEGMSTEWLGFGITRKLAKKPVMTLPYGSTLQSCRESIEDYIYEHIETSPWAGRDIFAASKMLSGIMWKSIGDTVVAAREAMHWLQQCSKVLSKENLPIIWHSPLGFRVYQGTVKWHSTVVNTQLCGRVQLFIAAATDQIDKYKQSNGVAPNFVHSMDACHLMSTVLLGSDIESWAMIHDSYGTHACDIDRLHVVLREAFVNMYQEHDVLQNFLNEQEAVCSSTFPERPADGTLDLSGVMQSEYFFG
jgi:DNA-directed RNA polymerase